MEIENLIFMENSDRFNINHKEWNERKFVKGWDFESQLKKIEKMKESMNKQNESMNKIKVEMDEMDESMNKQNESMNKIKIEMDEMRKWVRNRNKKYCFSDSDSE